MVLPLCFAGFARRRSCFAGILCLLRERSDFAGKLQSEHDEGFEPVGFDDQKVMVAEPVIQATESVAARLHFDAAIDAEKRNGNITAEAPSSSATQRHTLRGKAVVLQERNERSLGAIAFLAWGSTAAHGVLAMMSSAQPIGVLG